jgi:hypothetical protein
LLQISDVRKRELRLMFWNAVVKTVNITMVFGVPPMVLSVVLVPYEYTNVDENSTKPYITAPTAFTMLSLFNILRFPLVVLPKALRCVSEAINAASNIEKFMVEPAAPKHDTEGKSGVQFNKVGAGVVGLGCCQPCKSASVPPAGVACWCAGTQLPWQLLQGLLFAQACHGCKLTASQHPALVFGGF